jgi:hypothetical protein
MPRSKNDLDAITRQRCAHCRRQHATEVHHDVTAATREAQIATFEQRDDARVYARHARLEAARALLRPGGWKAAAVYAFNLRFA